MLKNEMGAHLRSGSSWAAEQCWAEMGGDPRPQRTGRTATYIGLAWTMQEASHTGVTMHNG